MLLSAVIAAYLCACVPTASADVGDNSIVEETRGAASIERQLQRELYTNADFGGKLHMRDSLEYEQLRLGYNGACRHLFPKVILRPETTEDVAVAVKVANKLGLKMSIRSGGHDYICASLKNDSLHLDLRKINVIDLLPESEVPQQYAQQPGVRLALLGTGNTWGDVLKVIPPDRYTMIHGQCLTVGVGGFLLKGGFNMLGGSARYGDGSSHVVRYTMVDVNGNIMRVDRDGVTKYDFKGNEIDKFTLDNDNDLFYGLKVAGTSLGIVTEFLYQIYEEAEPDPIFIPVVVRRPEDLLKLERLRAEKKYEVALNRVYILRAVRPSVQTRGVAIYSYAIYLAQILSGQPVMALALSDLRKPTDLDEVMSDLQRHGIKIPVPGLIRRFLLRSVVPRLIDPYIDNYSDWYLTPAEQEARGPQGLVSANMLSDNLAATAEVIFNDETFGLKTQSVHPSGHPSGCDFCFWVVGFRAHPTIFQAFDGVYRNATKETSNYIFEMACEYDTSDSDKARSCTRAMHNVKAKLNKAADITNTEVHQITNSPTCGAKDAEDKPFQDRYFGSNYPRLLRIKRYWDPENIINHCHSVGSTEQECCVEEA